MNDSESLNILIPEDAIDLSRTVFRFGGQRVEGKELARLLGMQVEPSDRLHLAPKEAALPPTTGNCSRS